MFKEIANDFVLPKTFDLNVLDNIPVAYKKQYEPVSVVHEGLHWMTYSVPGGGSIGFSRNTMKYLPEVVEHTAQYLEQRFPNLAVHRDRIHFIRTKGKIKEHRDESGRLSSINIGIKNSSTAITRFGNDDRYDTFHTNYTDYQCQDSGVYLLNTSILHSVINLTDDTRTLLTMTIADTYDVAYKQIYG